MKKGTKIKIGIGAAVAVAVVIGGIILGSRYEFHAVTLKMNWGFDGYYDDVLFGTGSSDWTISGYDSSGNPVSYNYQYNKEICYDFR